MPGFRDEPPAVQPDQASEGKPERKHVTSRDAERREGKERKEGGCVKTKAIEPAAALAGELVQQGELFRCKCEIAHRGTQ